MSALNAPYLENELLRLRPEATLELLRNLTRSLEEPPRPRRRVPRLAAVAALSLVLAAGLGATGSLSSAATSFERAAAAVDRAAKPQHALSARKRTAGSDQYRPG